VKNKAIPSLVFAGAQNNMAENTNWTGFPLETCSTELVAANITLADVMWPENPGTYKSSTGNN
jgi:hypothetical protein